MAPSSGHASAAGAAAEFPGGLIVVFLDVWLDSLSPEATPPDGHRAGDHEERKKKYVNQAHGEACLWLAWSRAL